MVSLTRPQGDDYKITYQYSITWLQNKWACPSPGTNFFKALKILKLARRRSPDPPGKACPSILQKLNMITKRTKFIHLYTTVILLGLCIFLFSLDWRSSHRELTFAILDVGQGDALFIESPTGTQVLLDGGPPRKILGRLAQIMPSFDRTIDAIIMSHPDADHISGFSDVLSSYKVGEIFESGIATDSKIYQNIKNEAERQKIASILARRGMRLSLGGGVVIDILFPDGYVYDWETNTGGIVAKLSYGDTSVMLAGDAPTVTEKMILAETSVEFLKSAMLKTGHHGSRTSSSPEFVQAVSPRYAFLSAGKENTYGHPHQEVLGLLYQVGARIFRTDLEGTIIMKSDGKKERFFFYE